MRKGISIFTAALVIGSALPAPSPAASLCAYDNGDGTEALAPCAFQTTPEDLGTDAHPFNTVKAEDYEAQGRRGITQTIHLPGCTLTIVGGIIVAATPTTPFTPACP